MPEGQQPPAQPPQAPPPAGDAAQASTVDDTGATPRELRFVFVQMLFALTVGEVARQVATLVAEVGVRDAASSYAHLILATALVATSWIGWTRSVAPGNLLPIRVVFSLPFFVLLLDVALVIFYFIIAKGVELPDPDTHVVTPSAKNETLWIPVVFCGYFLWDLLTKAVAPDDPNKPSPYEPLPGGEFWGRAWATLLCVGLTFIARFLFVDASTQQDVILADVSLLSIIFLFRALKQLPRKKKQEKQEERDARLKTKTTATVWVIVCALVFLGTIITSRYL